ncbi:MAG: hypothetical protein HY291_02625 [Planctomycetes bacterium]|nr:hypothetical protein [Planctomycetota bacterium]
MNGRGAMLGALACAAAFVFAASLLMPSINRQRDDLDLTVNPDVLKNMPPDIVLTQTALGSFRGLAVDYLWIRLQDLKDQGKYYEAMDLSRWISRLQPRFASVWEFHAWNMAYNISEATRTREEKWRWVEEGIRLLRDEGIPLNPAAPKLYQELAWIYFHRIGKYSAFAQDYFKLRHAMEWHQLLGEMPKGSAPAAVAWMKEIADAPESLDELLAQQPGMAAQIATLKALDIGLDGGLLRVVSELDAGAELTDAAGNLVGEREGFKLTASGTKLLEWHRDPALAGARAALLAFVRAKILREKYKMDPAFMLEMMRTYWPIDWRHPAAHSAYWGLLGARRCQDRPNADLFELMADDRLVVMSMKDLAFGGSIGFDPLTNYFNQLPEPLLLGAYEKAYLEAEGRLEKGGKYAGALGENYRGFLLEAVSLAYFYGSEELARQFYEKLRKQSGDRYDYSQPLDIFVRSELLKGKDRLEVAKPAIQGFAYRLFEEGYAAGRLDAAARYLGFIKSIYAYYQEQQKKLGPSFVKTPLPPLNDVLADAFAQYILSASRPHLTRARVWRRVPLELRQAAFDRIKDSLYEDAKRHGINPESAYPEPPGMDEIRKKRKAPMTPEAP